MSYNKVLSQLESVYQVAKPILEHAEPLHISDLIHHVCENNELYDREWDKETISKIDNNKLVSMVSAVLEGNGHMVSDKTILEGVEIFKDDES